MHLKFLFALIIISLNFSYLNAQDVWETYNAAFQEYFAEEKYEEALKLAEKEYEYAKNNDVPIYQLAFSCSDMGISLFALKKHKEAEVYLLKSVEHNLSMSGKDSDNTLAEINQLGMNYIALNENSKADSTFRVIINYTEKKYGKEHEETIDAVKTLINFYNILGDSIEVAKLRALYNIPEPDCNCPAEQAKKDSILKASRDTVKIKIINALSESDTLRSTESDTLRSSDSEIKSIVHVVKNGDTLYAISRKYSVSITDLKIWNKLKSNILFSGQKMIIFKN